MRRLMLALVLAVGLGGAAAKEGRPARHDGLNSWALVGADAAGVRFDLDMASIVTRENGQVYSVYRQAWPRTQSDGTVRFIEARIRRLDECGADRFYALSSVRMDAAGRTVAVEEYPKTPLLVAPGSPGELLHKAICGVAARRATLKPSNPVGLDDAAAWRRVGAAGAQVDWHLLEDGVVSLGPGVVMALVKRVSTAREPLPSGEVYTQTVAAHLYECEGRRWAPLATDYYDIEGALISTETTERDELTPTLALPGTKAATLLAAACAPGVARPMEQEATGSGTAWLGPKGYLVTAAHVVDGGRRFTLLQNGKAVGTAELVVADPVNDVAVLKPSVEGPPRRVLGLAAQPAPLGARVFAIGYPAPDRLGLAVKATGGEVNATAGRSDAGPDDPRFLQISAPVHGGNSGGPVVDHHGRVVGIVASGLRSLEGGELPQNINFALKAAYVRTLLADLPDLGAPAGEWSVTAGENAAEKVQDAVFLLLVQD